MPTIQGFSTKKLATDKDMQKEMLGAILKTAEKPKEKV